MLFVRLFGLVFGVLVLPVWPAWGDPPWRGQADQSVLLRDFPAAVRFDGGTGQRRVEVEELDRRGDTRQVRFTLLDGAGHRAPILAYLEVTVRTTGPTEAVTVDMMQSFVARGEGTMSDLCRAAAVHPVFQQASELSALLDFVNETSFRTALRMPGATPASASRAKVDLDGRERSAVPLARHMDILSGGEFQVAELVEVPTEGKPRYRVRGRPRTQTRPRLDTPVDCVKAFELAP